MKLSILLSGIRPSNWQKFYDSILESYHGEFELIIVTPFEMPYIGKALKDTTHVRFIQDWGSPMRCYQIGLVNAIGKYVTWGADDGVFMPNALDIAVKTLEETVNCVVVGKYTEGNPNNDEMNKIDYYYPARHSATNVEYMPYDCLMLMEGILPKELMYEVGGWDTKFECCPMGFIDLSIRLYHKGIKFIFQNEILFKCSHMPGMDGDHAPVHLGQTLSDIPRFQLMYSQQKSESRINIELDNWKSSDAQWKRRFGG